MHLKESLLYIFDKSSSFKTKSFINQLQDSSKLTLSGVRSRQWDSLKELLEFVYLKSEFYREKFKDANLAPHDIKCEADLSRFPVTTKEEVRRFQYKIISGKRDLLISSSGSGGSGISNTYLDFETASKKYAIYLRHLLRCGWDFDTKIIYFLPMLYSGKIVDYKNGIKQLFSTFIQNKIAHNYITNREVIHYDDFSPLVKENKLKFYCKKLDSNKEKIIMARADFLNILAYNLKKINFKPRRLKAIINIGALLPESLDMRIRSFFGCPVYNIYGSSEFSYIAGSCEKYDKLRINEETHFTEALKDGGTGLEPKKWGKILLTDLLNYSMPLIRYDSGDIGHIGEESYESSNLRVLDVGGRKRNCLLYDGNIITEKEICNLIFNEQNILQFYLKIFGHMQALLDIVKADRAYSINEHKLIGELENFGIREIKINYVDRIIENSNDKFQYICIK